MPGLPAALGSGSGGSVRWCWLAWAATRWCWWRPACVFATCAAADAAVTGAGRRRAPYNAGLFFAAAGRANGKSPGFMELIRGLHNLRPRHRGCVATIGNFDGVHLGHQRILEQVLVQARARGLKSTVILFEPQPQEFFAPDKAPPRLMTLRDKVRALREAGVDQLLLCRFDDAFRSQSAAQFVQRLLVDGLGIDYLVVGDDFRFGAGRDGDFAYLQQAGEKAGFEVTDTTTCLVDGERVSSTRIRAALQAGDLVLAAALLGRSEEHTSELQSRENLV